MDLKLISRQIVDYMYTKDASTFGYIKYSNFKRLISYVLNNHNNYELRKIFLYLIQEDYIIKQKNNKINSYLYRFNFIEREKTIDEPTIIYFD
tara:strand:+ start:509 stop:787 length:279 start_codon:yes stop_codon:yes gene_type:complete